MSTRAVILGAGSLVQRRILPALASLPEVTHIGIASRSGKHQDLPREEKVQERWNDYADALRPGGPGVVYVSLPNHLHYEWARRALEHGFSVVVDKPAVLRVSEAERLVELAARRGLSVAEANVWSWHPMAQKLRNLAADDLGQQIVQATFTSPPLAASNFRYDPSCGGGAIYDRGPYAISCGRVFFGESPKSISGGVLRNHCAGTDETFSVLLQYDRGSLLGTFSLGAEYCNRVTVITPKALLEADRIFTPPAELDATLRVTVAGQPMTEPVGSGDTFALFLHDFLQAAAQGHSRAFAEVLLSDTIALHQLRTAVLGDSVAHKSVGLLERV